MNPQMITNDFYGYKRMTTIINRILQKAKYFPFINFLKIYNIRAKGVTKLMHNTR